jgi:hypothetical protein|tara:strand:+ start:2892 stop:3251 length:360 start_codon:yes stop_codon:yes gene_type:complete
MKNPLLHVSFLVPAFLFIIHQILQKLIGVEIPLVDFYIDPFCFSALTIPIYVWERKILFHQSGISKLEMSILLTFLILFSEVVLPYFSSQFVADLLDVLMILLGGVWFYCFRPSRKVEK